MNDTLRLSTLSPVICPVCSQRYSPGSRFCPFDGEPLEAFEWDPDIDPLLGKVIDDRYKVESVIGEGGMGKVYAVSHLRLERTFAMKVLRTELARDRSLADRFIQEAKATAAINHPSIITICDFGTIPDGAPYFVMEMLEGQTLAKVMRGGGPLPARRAVGIAVKVAAALQAAHANGVVHRDLKPENIFLAQFSGREEVKVLDFGASRLLGASRITRTGVIFGTPHYMSPEQASGIDVDHRADIYAFGIILYEMFTGKVPFEAETFMGVITQQLVAKPVPPSEVHPSAKDLGVLEDITLKCLEKKPEARFANMEELRKALLSATPTSPRMRDSAGKVRVELASELELPSLAEIRSRSEEPISVPRNRVPLFAVGFVSTLVGVAIVWAASSLSKPTVDAASVAALSPATGSVTPLPIASQAPIPASATPPSVERRVRVTANVGGDVWQSGKRIGAVPLDLVAPDKGSSASYEFHASRERRKNFVIDDGTGWTIEIFLPTLPTGAHSLFGAGGSVKPPSTGVTPPAPPMGGSDEDLLERRLKRVP